MCKSNVQDLSRIHLPFSLHLLPEDPFETPIREGVDKFSHSVNVVLVIHYFFYVLGIKIGGFLGLPRISHMIYVNKFLSCKLAIYSKGITVPPKMH